MFTKLSIAFVVPGGNAARLGLPDVLFFAVFLGAAARFGLRPFLTWLLMVAGLGITIVLTTFWVTGGLPALPAIALGFLLANCDLLWARLAPGGLRSGQAKPVTVLPSAHEQRDGLDVRRVREHVDRRRPHEPVAVLLVSRFVSPASVVGLHET